MRQEQQEFDLLQIKLDEYWADQFAISSNKRGIERYERIVEVRANRALEDDDFRKRRIVNRLTTLPPFSMPFLRAKLNEIVGVDQWQLLMDYDNYNLIIKVYRTDRNWYNELKITLEAVKPCNIGMELNTLIRDTASGVFYFGAGMPTKLNCYTDISYQL